MNNPIKSFQEFIFEAAQARLPKVPNLMELYIEWLAEEGFRLVGKTQVRTKFGSSILCLFSNDIAGSPLAFLFHPNNSIHVIYDNEIYLKYKSTPKFRRNGKRSTPSLSYHIAWMLDPDVENYDSKRKIFQSIKNKVGASSEKVLRDKKLRDALDRSIFSSKTKNGTLSDVLTSHFGDLSKVYPIYCEFNVEIARPIMPNDPAILQLEYYKKFQQYGFVESKHEEDKDVWNTQYLELGLPVDAVTWTDHKRRSTYGNSWDENHYVCEVSVGIAGRAYFTDFAGHRHPTRNNRDGRAVVTLEDWNNALKGLFESFIEEFTEHPDVQIIDHSTSSETNQDRRTNSQLSDTIEDLW